MPDPTRTEIAIVLDRSGSMHAIREDMIGGFSAFVEQQRRAPGTCTLSLYQFDDHFDVVYEAVPVDQAPPLKLTPRGRTALLDGIGKALALIADRHDKLAPAEPPGTVIVIVITDGRENASTEWSLAALRSAVSDAECKRNWRVLFLGATADAFDEGRSMGVRSSIRYHASATGVRTMYDSLAHTTLACRSNAPPSEGSR